MLLKAVLLLGLSSCISSYKILVYSPTLSRSHMIQNGRVGDTLAKGGHNVTVLELDLAIEPGSLKQIKHATLWAETFDWPDRVPGEFHIRDPIVYTSMDLFNGLPFFLEMFGGSCLAVLKSPHIMNKIRDAKFDAVMFEQFDFCPFFIAHLLGIKVKVWMSSCPIMEHQASLSGVPPAYSYVPVSDGSSCGDKMTFSQRFVNVILAYALDNAYLKYWDEYHGRLKKEFGETFPSPLDLAKSIDLVFINTDELVDFPRPLPPNVIHVGGLGMESVNTQLTPLFDDLMKKGNKGVVYFSFGTMVSTNDLGETYMKNVLDTFRKFEDYFFIVKVTKNDNSTPQYARDIKNVHVDTWVPQPGVLAHPRLQFFITHGGYNGIMEASRFSVPLLAIGVFGDQTRNAKLVERNGWGVALDKTSLLYGTKEFEEKIKEMISNPIYKKNALRTTKLLRTKPQTGEQKLLSYMKFLEENDGHLPELKSIANQLSTIEYYNIDVWGLLALGLVFLIVFILLLIRIVVRLILSKVKKQKTE